MNKPHVLILAGLPDGVMECLHARFPQFEFHDAREPLALDENLTTATVTYGVPPVNRLADAAALRWIQLVSAGVPQQLCPPARERDILVTNLAGLYGTSIAEHALMMMLVLSRNFHVALRNQRERKWDRTVAHAMADLHGKTLAIVGLGNIGQSIARVARAHGMRVIGCRRTDRSVSVVDHVYPLARLNEMLAEADIVAVAAPLTARTEGMLGSDQFAAIKRGAIYINVSRGSVAQEAALLEGLRSGHVAAAGLDVYAVEPLAPEHPFWEMPQVIVSPHYSGEVVNQSSLPAERFMRNLHSWLDHRPLEGEVDLEWGY